MTQWQCLCEAYFQELSEVSVEGGTGFICSNKEIMHLSTGHQYIYFIASNLWKKMILETSKKEKSHSLFITLIYKVLFFCRAKRYVIEIGIEFPWFCEIRT